MSIVLGRIKYGENESGRFHQITLVEQDNGKFILEIGYYKANGAGDYNEYEVDVHNDRIKEMGED